MQHPWAKRAQIRETGRKKISRDFLPQVLPEMAVHCQPAPSAEKEMEKLSITLPPELRQESPPTREIFLLECQVWTPDDFESCKICRKVPRILF